MEELGPVRTFFPLVMVGKKLAIPSIVTTSYILYLCGVLRDEVNESFLINLSKWDEIYTYQKMRIAEGKDR